LEEGNAQPYYGRLLIDRDRDGLFEDDELLEADPKDIRGKMWSTFETVVDVPAVDPENGVDVVNSYPLSFWFVHDPDTSEEELVLRFSRRGWMEGRANIGGVDAVVLLTESVMDGVFDGEDSWALASSDSSANVYSHEHARPAERHAWLLDRAYRLSEIHPSGRKLVLTPFDPKVTRAEEAAMDDHLAEDRRAARSGRTVAFLHGYVEAETLAQAEGKLLFVDFETEWCGPCHVMDEWVYTADVVVDAASAYVSVKVDGDEHPDLKERFLVEGYPTLLVIDADGAVVKRAAGYMSVAEMTEFLTRGS
jgi:thiol-disulfide isomerase/thioredoxin